MFLRIFRRACNYTKAKMKTYTCRYTKRRPFSPSFYVTNYELLPMAIISILDGCMVAFCSIRTFLNTDIKFSNHVKTRGEDIELLKEPRCLKFYCPTQEYEANMDLYNLYQEMIEAQKCEDEPDSCERKEGGGWIISVDKEEKETPPEGEEPEPPEKKLTDAQRRELERKEKERKEKEQKQLEQNQLEQKEKDRKALEQKEKDRKQLEQKEKDRKQLEQKEKERKQLEQKEKERKELEQKEKQRKEMERKEKERKEKERKEMEQKEKQRKELEQKEKQRKEMERKEKERKEKERKEMEQKAKEAPAKKKPDSQQKEPKEDKSKSQISVSSSGISIGKRESGGGSLSLEQIMKKLVIKDGVIQSPELLFGATMNTAHHRKAYLQDGIQTIVTSSETSYDKGHKVIDDETTKIDTNRKKDTMHQRVIRIVHPSGKSDIAMQKFYLDRGGGKVQEIKESQWMTTYPAAMFNIEKIKPSLHQTMTTSVQTQTKQENDKITRTEITTKQYPTGAKKIREETKVSYINSKKSPEVIVKYRLIMGGKETTLNENEWEEMDIRPHISYAASKSKETTNIETENISDANGNKIKKVTTTHTLGNGNKEITVVTTTEDKNGKITTKTEHYKEKKNDKRRLLITGFF